MGESKPRKQKIVHLESSEELPLAEVIDYLKSFSQEEVNKMFREIAQMCFLSYARLHSPNRCDSEKLRLTCLESCDAMDKHASTMRQALGVAQPKFERSSMVMPIAPTSENGSSWENHTESSNGHSSEDQAASAQRKEIKDEIDQIFGDD